MHEFTIAENLVAAATAEAGRVGALRVVAIDCRIGELRQVDDLLLSEAFSLASEGTACRGASLRLEKVPLKAACATCGREFPVRNWEWMCPACGTEGRLLGGGDELELTSIEVETHGNNSSRP